MEYVQMSNNNFMLQALKTEQYETHNLFTIRRLQ